MNNKSNPLICPHLVDGHIVYCEVSAGGIYIPMPGHVEKFCKSGNPQCCLHYLKSNELLRQHEDNNGADLSGTRRKYRRFNQKFPLFIDPRSVLDTLPEENNKKAFTVDLGLGGLQVSTIEELTPHQEVSFFFDGDFSTPFWRGRGEVRWCKPVGPKDRYLAGLSFLDPSHKHVMEHHLEEQLS